MFRFGETGSRPMGLLRLTATRDVRTERHRWKGFKLNLSLIMFDDGTGEGDSHGMELTLRMRQQARNERVKWVNRFVALRNTAELRVAAQSLYQDIVDAARSAEINPDE